jgi:hypothetical protein
MYEGEFRAMFPNTSMPQQLSEELINEFGGDVVLEGPQATGGNHYQYSQAAGVEQLDGKWYTKYILGPVFTDTTDETGNVTFAAAQFDLYKYQKDNEQAASVRQSRVEKLKECDWTQVADSPVDKAVWATYRQALRDITTQEGFPWTVTWPTSP